MNRFTKAAVVGLALTTTAAPLPAEARSREDRQARRNDSQDYRAGRRDDRQDFRREQRRDHNNRDWWRGRDDFRDYRGARNGYWYAPSYGYYRVEPRFQDFRWQRGGYLPHGYRSYSVRDPHAYNLRPAPRGYRYVHAGGDIVLIAAATGLIVGVLNNAYQDSAPGLGNASQPPVFDALFMSED
ncbi:RcnB family protein [Brevundimonas sp.]|uniref:RcnB family protein n=1 Tax=Brevundimonas sp. TaxID=1871086 RepID=UPI003566A2BF